MLAETGYRLKGLLVSNVSGSNGISRGSLMATEYFFGLKPGSVLMVSRSVRVLIVDILH